MSDVVFLAMGTACFCLPLSAQAFARCKHDTDLVLMFRMDEYLRRQYKPSGGVVDEDGLDGLSQVSS